MQDSRAMLRMMIEVVIKDGITAPIEVLTWIHGLRVYKKC